MDEAIHGMLHHKTIIVPSAFMRLCTSAQKLLPTPLLMPIVARQQKTKLGCQAKRTKHLRGFCAGCRTPARGR